MNHSQLTAGMNQRLAGNSEYMLKNSMKQLSSTVQMGGIQQMTQSSKTIPKKDHIRESNQNLNTTQGIKSSNHLAQLGEAKMKTSHLTNIGKIANPHNAKDGHEGRYKKTNHEQMGHF